MLAAYFDKNHLYHIGDSVMQNLIKSFLQDFFEEAKNLNPMAYKII